MNTSINYNFPNYCVYSNGYIVNDTTGKHVKPVEKKFGLPRSAINRAANGNTWKHIGVDG